MEFNLNIPEKSTYLSNVSPENHYIKSKIPIKENTTFTYQNNLSHFEHYPLNPPKKYFLIDFFKEDSSSISTPLLSLPSITFSSGDSSSNKSTYHPNESIGRDLININYLMPYSPNNTKVESTHDLPKNKNIWNFSQGITFDSGSMEALESHQVQNERYDNNQNMCVNTIKGPWSFEEDMVLLQLVNRFGSKSWSLIAKFLRSRTGQQCRERWNNNLHPDIKKDSWSEEEEKRMIEAHKELGNKWSEISRRLPGRSGNTVKNHWNATKRRLKANKQIMKRNSSKGATIILENYIMQVIREEETKKEQDTSKVIMKTRGGSSLFHVQHESLKGGNSFLKDEVRCSVQNNVPQYDAYMPVMESSKEIESVFVGGVNIMDYEDAMEISPKVQLRKEMNLIDLIN